MSLLQQTPALLTALRGAMTPKFLATRSADGIPNVVPCISLLPTEDQEDTSFLEISCCARASRISRKTGASLFW